MKTSMVSSLCSLLILSVSAFAADLPEPGPEAAGLSLRLVISPKADAQDGGYDVQLDLVSASREAIPVRVKPFPADNTGSFKQVLEEATSIESYPPFEPWLGQVRFQPDTKDQPNSKYLLQPGETFTIKWETRAQELKNKVGNPLEVQNPFFSQPGLHAIHANLTLEVGGHEVFLRSNEQTVPIQGSRELPKHTYGPIVDANDKDQTATLGMGFLQKVAVGDKFTIRTGNIGMTWTLTITKVESHYSFGNLLPSQTSPLPMFPARGFYASLIPAKKEIP